MKIFNKFFLRLMKAALREDQNSKSGDIYEMASINSSGSVAKSNSSNSLNSKSNFRFTVYPASGGYVIEHNFYKHDNTIKPMSAYEGPSLTIVDNAEKIGEAVQQIILMEYLKN